MYVWCGKKKNIKIALNSVDQKYLNRKIFVY